MKPYLLLDFFLDTPRADALLRWTIDQEWQFQKSGVIGDPSWRDSRLLYAFPPFDQELRDRMRGLAPSLIAHFGLPPVEIGEIEAQLTAHNDGHYFRRHQDNRSRETEARVLTYVYYFFREPKPFAGGELEIAGDILPVRHNSIVFFPSETWHEVFPVRCASRAWPDSRFTINGWLRRIAEVVPRKTQCGSMGNC